MRLLFLILCLNLSTIAAAAPRVVTSIVPLQEMTAAIMSGVAEPEVIIDAQASPHHFALKPSQMRRLQQADLVIWISRDFESGFKRLADILPASTRRLELLPGLGIDGSDGHIWYAPDLLLGSIEVIVTALEQLDPQNRGRYRANANTLASAIRTLEVAVRARWENRPPQVLTDHDFLGHFTRSFGFDAIEAVHDSHDDHAGLKRLRHLESLLQKQQIKCLLTQSAAIAPLASELAQKYRLEIINLEPGSERPGILARLDRLVSALDACA